MKKKVNDDRSEIVAKPYNAPRINALLKDATEKQMYAKRVNGGKPCFDSYSLDALLTLNREIERLFKELIKL